MTFGHRISTINGGASAYGYMQGSRLFLVKLTGFGFGGRIKIPGWLQSIILILAVELEVWVSYWFCSLHSIHSVPRCTDSYSKRSRNWKLWSRKCTNSDTPAPWSEPLQYSPTSFCDWPQQHYIGNKVVCISAGLCAGIRGCITRRCKQRLVQCWWHYGKVSVNETKLYC